jgi:DNA-binding MarR family transcriptional regulator/GNAT superfamily N-acetyltransferase
MLNNLSQEPDISTDIAAFRRFNRFHTRIAGALNEHLLASPFSLIEARLIYELGLGGETAASDLVARLGVDKGYMSRLLAALEQQELIRRSPSATDARRQILTLTEAGRAVRAELDRASAAEVAALLAPIDTASRHRLIAAMRQIETILGGTWSTEAFILRDPRPGDLGLVASRQAALYTAEYGWDWTFEALVARILADYVDTFDPAHERAWIAERDGEIAGSVFVMRKDAETAKLRLLYVEPATRGHGLGRRLVEEAISFARIAGYRRMTLWTNSILDAARAIYKGQGFHLVAEEPHRSFGHDLIGQTWDLDL